VALAAELKHLLAEGVETVAQAIRHLLLRAAIDKDRTQRFVEALAVAGGLGEEFATKGVIHHRPPLV
jgi:hypothetical protein